MTKGQIRQQILELVDEYAKHEFKDTIFVGGETVIPPSGKLLGASELRNLVDAFMRGNGAA